MSRRSSAARTPPRLNFTPEFTSRLDRSTEDISNASENAGIRPYKFPTDPSETNGNHSNDYPYFRLGEMYLIRAEAAFELGNVGQALSDINTIRTRAGADPLDSVDRAAILKERLLELNWEARRRQDLIRADESIVFGSGGGNLFTRGWQYKSPSQPYRVVFPDPAAADQRQPGADAERRVLAPDRPAYKVHPERLAPPRAGRSSFGPAPLAARAGAVSARAASAAG